MQIFFPWQLIVVGPLLVLHFASHKRAEVTPGKDAAASVQSVERLHRPFTSVSTLLMARSHDCGSYGQLRSQFCLELGSQFHTCVENVLYSTYSSGQLVVCTKSNTVCCINVSVTSAVEFYDLKRLCAHTEEKTPR